jgi:hypothetical protein
MSATALFIIGFAVLVIPIAWYSVRHLWWP